MSYVPRWTRGGVIADTPKWPAPVCDKCDEKVMVTYRGLCRDCAPPVDELDVLEYYL